MISVTGINPLNTSDQTGPLFPTTFRECEKEIQLTMNKQIAVVNTRRAMKNSNFLMCFAWNPIMTMIKTSKPVINTPQKRGNRNKSFIAMAAPITSAKSVAIIATSQNRYRMTASQPGRNFRQHCAKSLPDTTPNLTHMD